MSEQAGHKRARLGVGAAIVLVVIALGVTIVIGMVRSATAPIDDVVLETAAPREAGVYVHVHGAVAHPGLYRLATGGRVVDAIASAGGFTDDADRAGVNLARQVDDGEQLRVPRAGEQPPLSEDAGDGRIDLNTADAAALDTLPRIGPALAARIIDWREQNGRFTSIDDLLAVPGIGDKMLQALRELVRV